jgi:hypothetical protein
VPVKKSFTQSKAKVKQQPPPAEHRTTTADERRRVNRNRRPQGETEGNPEDLARFRRNARNTVALLLEPNSIRAKNIKYLHSLLDGVLSSGNDRGILAVTRLLQGLVPVR